MKREKLTLAWRGNTARVPEVVFVEEVPAAAPSVRVITPTLHVVQHAANVEEDPVDLCLQMWKSWMATANDRDLGAQTMRGLSGEGDGHGVDVHDAQRASDMRMAEATDAMISSLSRIHVWAIYRACSLATVWRFPNANWEDVVCEARNELEKKLRKNICTAVLF
ncbi:hypothetical protein AB4Z19_15505 [Pseudoduganella sp. RAF19]|uniref:hypothetical protein n=1 Tax=Bacteria TaxID=2 RepID=UPI003F9A6394